MEVKKRKGTRYLTAFLAVLFLGGWASASAQSLVELARKERLRRQRLSEQRSLAEASQPVDTASAKTKRASSEREDDTASENDASSPPVLASMDASLQLGESNAPKEAGESARESASTIPLVPEKAASPASRQFESNVRLSSKDFYLRGGYYADWFRAAFGEGLSSSQLSNRLKLEAGAAPVMVGESSSMCGIDSTMGHDAPTC